MRTSFLWLRRAGLLSGCGTRVSCRSGFSCAERGLWSTQAPFSRCTGLVAPRHVKPSRVSRWIPNHWAAREAPSSRLRGLARGLFLDRERRSLPTASPSPLVDRSPSYSNTVHHLGSSCTSAGRPHLWTVVLTSAESLLLQVGSGSGPRMWDLRGPLLRCHGRRWVIAGTLLQHQSLLSHASAPLPAGVFVPGGGFSSAVSGPVPGCGEFGSSPVIALVLRSESVQDRMASKCCRHSAVLLTDFQAACD